ncbi:MAG: MFS transporter [Haliea sp.]|uniref:MFS transporter n=1 Tax=Haliea sp. TaxID=1932666 RepID=UPI0032EED1CA
MFYGWLLVGVAFLVLMVSSGSIMYSYSVVAVPLGAAFEASRMTMMLGITGMTLAGGLLSPFMGGLIDRGSLRRMMFLGAVGLASGYLLLSFTTASWQVPIIYAALMMLGINLLGPLTTSTLLARWFSRRRGMALGVAAVGTSVGGFVFPPLVQWLIDSFEWRNALRILGLGSLLLTLPAIWLVANRPADRGLHPDGDAPPPSGGPLPPPLSTAALLRERNFWLVALSISLLFGVYSALLANLVPFALDTGSTPDRAAFLISAMALAGIAGKLGFGAIADRVDLRAGLAASMALVITGVVFYVVGDGYSMLLFGSISLGLAAGGMLPVWGALLAVLFGAANYGRVMGMMNPVIMPMTLLGPPLAGLVHDATGSYTGAFLGFVVALLAGLVLLPMIRMPAAVTSS